jgi:predicted RND superfamily exporter protein
MLADDLSRLAAAPNEVLGDVDRMVSRFLPLQLDSLRDALEAEPVTLQTIPPEIARDWLLPDGRARIQVLPKVRTGSSRELGEFVADVRAVAPAATGPAAMIAASSATILGSFRAAAVAALVSITLILVIVLRRLIDVLLVLAPLLLSSLMTVVALVLLPLPLNYANIIVLPLLLGIGVSFNIYFVMNWRAGQTVVLASATARAILFSALTTGSAFGALALSRHPGTASMGELLLISLGFTLMASLSFLPALLASWQPKIPADDAGRAVIP